MQKILVTGSNGLLGQKLVYKLKDKTEEAITKDGWLKTGDVAVLSAEGGRMKIIDRKKNIFKLQQG